MSSSTIKLPTKERRKRKYTPTNTDNHATKKDLNHDGLVGLVYDLLTESQSIITRSERIGSQKLECNDCIKRAFYQIHISSKKIPSYKCQTDLKEDLVPCAYDCGQYLTLPELNNNIIDDDPSMRESICNGCWKERKQEEESNKRQQ